MKIKFENGIKIEIPFDSEEEITAEQFAAKMQMTNSLINTGLKFQSQVNEFKDSDTKMPFKRTFKSAFTPLTKELVLEIQQQMQQGKTLEQISVVHGKSKNWAYQVLQKAKKTGLI